ncbi:bacteriocin immunity protein [Pseudomonas sp. SWRI12]|uniref:Bacteriocin immunity protein n=1 Tax=Pseudomonas zanjanensis TaxID=2745496 RepID=A0A923FA43_9PSED|nr:bacteriocin immunity protein [Pseudomonas zanjanensis]MBV4497152.1 bacteriocin immunity protein [Pseudomonas zanjanensis]
MKKSIIEITEEEFLAFVLKISEGDFPSEKAHNNAVLDFKRISEHPAGSDLLFYPEPGKESSEAIVDEIKNWRAANGKPGFKQP